VPLLRRHVLLGWRSDQLVYEEGLGVAELAVAGAFELTWGDHKPIVPPPPLQMMYPSASTVTIGDRSRDAPPRRPMPRVHGRARSVLADGLQQPVAGDALLPGAGVGGGQWQNVNGRWWYVEACWEHAPKARVSLAH
jgi:hypothetical protein